MVREDKCGTDEFLSETPLRSTQPDLVEKTAKIHTPSVLFPIGALDNVEK